jgi:hypothetical protein
MPFQFAVEDPVIIEDVVHQRCDLPAVLFGQAGVFLALAGGLIELRAVIENYRCCGSLANGLYLAKIA